MQCLIWFMSSLVNRLVFPHSVLLLTVELDSGESSDEYDDHEPCRDAKLIDMASKVRNERFSTPQICPVGTDAVWLTTVSSNRCPWWFPRWRNPVTAACAAMTNYWMTTLTVMSPYPWSESISSWTKAFLFFLRSTIAQMCRSLKRYCKALVGLAIWEVHVMLQCNNVTLPSFLDLSHPSLSQTGFMDWWFRFDLQQSEQHLPANHTLC